MRRFASNAGDAAVKRVTVVRFKVSTGEDRERSHPDCRTPVRCPFRFNPCPTQKQDAVWAPGDITVSPVRIHGQDPPS